MYDNPGSLRDLCIDFVCDNIEKLFFADQNSGNELPPSEHELFCASEPEYMFIDKNIFLPMEVSETLLTKLSLRNKLNDEILSLFSNKNVYLRFVIFFKL